MKKSLFKIASLFLAVMVLSGCISVKTYVDPQYKEARYEDIQKQTSVPVVLKTQFQRNGEHFKGADKELAGNVERIVRASGVFDVSTANAPNELSVVANNIADMGDAAAKGFATGLTFGGAGSAVTDFYEFTVTMKNADGTEHKELLKHALHTTIGNKAAPVAGEPTTPADGFSRVVEDVLLAFIHRMQKSGALAAH